MEEQDETGIIRNPDGTYPKGVSGNPNGRPIDTLEKKIEKKAIKQIVEEYKESLSDVLPHLSPILKEMALGKDIQAIKEVHDRVMGKSEQHTDITTAGKPLVFLSPEVIEKNEIDSGTEHDSKG